MVGRARCLPQTCGDSSRSSPGMGVCTVGATPVAPGFCERARDQLEAPACASLAGFAVGHSCVDSPRATSPQPHQAPHSNVLDHWAHVLATDSIPSAKPPAACTCL